MVEVQYVEYDAIHRENFVYDIPNGLDAWLLVFAQTPAIFLVEGKHVRYPANTITLFKPKQRIYYCACEDRYSNDWIRFTTDEIFVRTTTFPGAVPTAINNQEKTFHRLFQLMSYEAERNTTTSAIVIGKLLEIMFMKINELVDDRSKTRMTSTLQELRSDIYQHPNEKWSLQLMASKLNISTGHLASSYKQAFGVSCTTDVINSRISLAKKYLLNSNHTIAEIAELCGYQSPEHFDRQFRAVTNYTPTRFRADLAFLNNVSLLQENL